MAVITSYRIHYTKLYDVGVFLLFALKPRNRAMGVYLLPVGIGKARLGVLEARPELARRYFEERNNFV